MVICSTPSDVPKPEGIAAVTSPEDLGRQGTQIVSAPAKTAMLLPLGFLPTPPPSAGCVGLSLGWDGTQSWIDGTVTCQVAPPMSGGGKWPATNNGETPGVVFWTPRPFQVEGDHGGL
jgi:hypothetical protein